MKKLDYHTWTKLMITRRTPPIKLKKLFIKRYGKKMVPLLKDVLNAFQVIGREKV